jgi:hypothetical protein
MQLAHAVLPPRLSPFASALPAPPAAPTLFGTGPVAEWQTLLARAAAAEAQRRAGAANDMFLQSYLGYLAQHPALRPGLPGLTQNQLAALLAARSYPAQPHVPFRVTPAVPTTASFAFPAASPLPPGLAQGAARAAVPLSLVGPRGGAHSTGSGAPTEPELADARNATPHSHFQNAAPHGLHGAPTAPAVAVAVEGASAQELVFQCPEASCRRVFTQSSNLRRHMMVHTGERPFTCERCSRSFARKATLVTHERTHTGERPYACGMCNKSFSTRHGMLTHRKSHARAGGQPPRAPASAPVPEAASLQAPVRPAVAASRSPSNSSQTTESSAAQPRAARPQPELQPQPQPQPQAQTAAASA